MKNYGVARSATDFDSCRKAAHRRHRRKRRRHTQDPLQGRQGRRIATANPFRQRHPHRPSVRTGAPPPEGEARDAAATSALRCPKNAAHIRLLAFFDRCGNSGFASERLAAFAVGGPASLRPANGAAAEKACRLHLPQAAAARFSPGAEKARDLIRQRKALTPSPCAGKAYLPVRGEGKSPRPREARPAPPCGARKMLRAYALPPCRNCRLRACFTTARQRRGCGNSGLASSATGSARPQFLRFFDRCGKHRLASSAAGSARPQSPLGKGARGRIATPVCALARNDRGGN